MYAPIALFVYNRLELTKQVVAQLLTNTLAYETDLYIFADGSRNDEDSNAVKSVREYIHELDKESAARHLFKSMTIVERSENWGKNRNITEGINQVLRDHETIIVLEDDIFVSEFFLDFMNNAFNIYRDDQKVMHVSAFTNLDIIHDHPLLVYDNPYSDLMNEAYFTPHMAHWGWGTWRDRWEEHFVQFTSEREALEGLKPELRDKMQYEGNYPCLGLLKQNPIPWSICWEIAINKADGLCLTPGYTITRNIGLNKQLKWGSANQLQYFNFDRTPAERIIKINRRPIAPKADIEALFAEAIKEGGVVYTPLGKVALCAMNGGQKFGEFAQHSGSFLGKAGKAFLALCGKVGQELAVLGRKAGPAFAKFGGEAGVVLKKIFKIILALLKRLFKEIVRLTPYVVGFLQTVFRMAADGIKKLINLIMSKM